MSIDIDVVDPAFAPGTGTPEPGGFSSRELFQMIRGLKGLSVVGGDIVEVSPSYDQSDITAQLAANVAFEMLSVLHSEGQPLGSPMHTHSDKEETHRPQQEGESTRQCQTQETGGAPN